MKIPWERSKADIGLDTLGEAAADWVARWKSGLAAEEERELDFWLSADPSHRAAFEKSKFAWMFMEKPRLAGRSDEAMRAVARSRAAHSRAVRRRVLGISLIGVAAATAVAVILLPLRRAAVPAVLSGESAESVVVKPNSETLPDGSVVELNSGAEISVQFTPSERGVRLIRGEAHFAVAKNPSRPFVVTAGGVQVRAVGTAFDVLLGADAVDVLVTEGKVSIDHSKDGAIPGGPASVQTPATMGASAGEVAPPTTLAAGQRLVVAINSETAPSVVPVTAPEIDRDLAWRSLRVEFNRTSLSDALAIFNRGNRIQLSLADPELGGIRIGGVFWANDPEGFVRLIESSASLKSVHLPDGRIVLQRP